MCCPLAFLPNELRHQKYKSLGLHSETPRCKTPTNLTVDRCSVQFLAFECLNCTHKLVLFSLVMLFTAKGIVCIQLVQGLYLNRRSVSALEPEMPLTSSPAFRTLPLLSSSSSLVGEAQAENQRSNLYLFLLQDLLKLPCVHF